MKSFAFIIITLLLTVILFLFSPQDNSDEVEVYAETTGTLLQPQKNVAIVTVKLSQSGLSLTDPDDISRLRFLQNDFIKLKNVSKIESILNASRVISEGDDILVSKAIPLDHSLVNKEYLVSLFQEIQDFPELSPYVSKDRDTTLFYLYYSNTADARSIHEDLINLQKKWKTVLPFDFTGRAPIIAETERLLTKDIALFLPLLIIMVIAVFSLFRSLKAIGASLVLIILSMAFAYVFIRFLKVQDSPLILLIPVFTIGLLSDYLLHYFYHAFHSPLDAKKHSLRKMLIFPLSLTALSTITGFLSLTLINASGHLQLGSIIAVSVAVTWFGVFYWIDMGSYPNRSKVMFANFQRIQGLLFARIVKYRLIFFVLIGSGVLWGGVQLFYLSIEPYPIQQLPDTNTIKKADQLINNDFFGTLPFFIEVDTGEKNGLLKKETLLEIDKIHKEIEDKQIGYAFSMLSVLKRMNYYFMGSEETLLSSSEFDDFYDALIEQYLLYYSSSVDPLEYESLLDNSYRFFSIKGLMYYHDQDDLQRFTMVMKNIEQKLPDGWSLSNYGMTAQLVTEQKQLKNNWGFSFLSGSLLIFLTVWIYYRKLSLAFISLLPGIVSMIISFGLISMAGISIDAFSIIFVAIITGLVVDYSIHTLIGLDQISEVKSLEEGFSQIIGYSGIPIFMSFTTSILSFSVLFLSSFRGARNLGFLLISSLVLSFLMSLYLIPLILLPIRQKRGTDHD